ncbi:MAG: glycosyltransferase [Firmicutes bacterium]|nr:glycosyltransferase [Bacillota bacterium]
MGPGTFEAKFVPLSMVNCVDTIFVLREKAGPEIEKVQYIVLPKFVSKVRILKILVPFYLAYYTKKFNCSYIIGYHFVPHAIFAYLASIITNVPFIYAQTGLDIQHQATKTLFKSIVKVVLKKASYINVPGNFSKSYWKEFGINPEKINILHSTIDTDYWVSDPNGVRIYDFIFLGRLDPVKRIDMIIQGFKLLINNTKELSRPTLIIVGSGPDEPMLKKLVSDIGLSEYVKFTGFVSEPIFYLQQSRFLIMSSFTEGLPTAMMQAMSCEVVPITNLVGNISDIITNNITGLVHEGRNLKDVCQLMGYALDLDEKVETSLRVSARELVVREHAYKQIPKKWERVFNSNPSFN